MHHLFERTGEFSRAVVADAPADLAQADIAECGKLAVSVAKAVGEKCERCWIYSDDSSSCVKFSATCSAKKRLMASTFSTCVL